MLLILAWLLSIASQYEAKIPTEVFVRDSSPTSACKLQEPYESSILNFQTQRFRFKRVLNQISCHRFILTLAICLKLPYPKVMEGTIGDNCHTYPRVLEGPTGDNCHTYPRVLEGPTGDDCHQELQQVTKIMIKRQH